MLKKNELKAHSIVPPAHESMLVAEPMDTSLSSVSPEPSMLNVFSFFTNDSCPRRKVKKCLPAMSFLYSTVFVDDNWL